MDADALVQEALNEMREEAERKAFRQAVDRRKEQLREIEKLPWWLRPFKFMV